ncbi:hypothetical protein DPMN_194936 [Dreissena polymorpha]|uniref:Uncharacterized protein n=1 Tax=Dreissena polymorpha TaxID=45954 RepID=A0A9D4BE95_DREPO|nr:hypothetical protein DPMN_194936 [Dreissena polymorpha]
MEINWKLHMFDLEMMDVCVVFPGIVSRKRVCIVTKRKQLLVTSRGGKNVKLYNITNGCVDAIIKTGYTTDINDVVVNDPGTLVAVGVDEGPIVLMDLVTYSRMYEISNSARYGDYFASYMLFTRDSTRLLFSADKGLESGEQRSDNVDHLFCWDIEHNKEIY